MNWLLRLRKRRSLDRDLEEELAFHRSMRRGDTNAPPFGNPVQIKESMRDMWTWAWIEILVQDVRYGLRGLLRNKGFALTAFLLLTLGIGANTAMFTIVKRVLLDPLPYPHSDRLLRIWSTQKPAGSPFSVTALDYLDWEAQAKTFDGLAAYSGTGITLNGEGDPELLTGSMVSASLFSVLGVQPTLGRDFRPEENEHGFDHVIILSHPLWRRKFGGRPDVIGRAIRVNGEPYQVIGVMPPAFSFPDPANEAWIPIAFKGGDPQWINRFAHFLRVVARLGPSQSFAAATAEMEAIASRLERAHPETDHLGVQLRFMKDWLTGDARIIVFTLYGAVTLLLLIVCSNLAGLLIERAAARRAEYSVRTALGASRLRLIVQMTVETGLLSLAGGLAGIGFADALLEYLKVHMPDTLPRMQEIRLDPQILGFSLALTLLTGALFGLAPAMQLPQLVRNARGTAATGMRRSMRAALVIIQVALAGVLLAGAGLFLRSLNNLSHVELGFEPKSVVAANLVLGATEYPSPDRILRFTQQLDQRLTAAPGVLAAGFSTTLPLSGQGWGSPISVAGRLKPAGKPDSARIQAVSPRYLQALQSPLRLGRQFTERDDARSPFVVLVTETFVHDFLLPGESPIGQRVTLGAAPSGADDDQPWRTVVGVIAPWHHVALDGPPEPGMIIPYAQIGNMAPMVGRGLYLAVRSTTQKGAVNAIRTQVASLDPSLPIRDVRPLTGRVDAALAPQNLRTGLLAGFAGIALLLAGVGLYGVIAFAVTQRGREIGVRMALGAEAAQISRLIVADGARLGLSGIALGLAATVALSRVAEHLLFGVSARDIATLTAVALILAAVTLLASYIPARRAASIDPIQTLRQE